MEDVLAESWFMDDSKDVNTVIKEAIANIGENLNLGDLTAMRQMDSSMTIFTWAVKLV